MKKLSYRTKKILLPISFAIAFGLSFALSFERLREMKLFFMLLFFAAVAADIFFLMLLNGVLKRTLYPKIKSGFSRMAGALARRMYRLAAKVTGRTSDGSKVFLEGKNERAFVFEFYEGKQHKTHRKLPKLPKNADEKEKIRYEYAAYVFRKDKDISPALTPNEVEKQLDIAGDDHRIFERYNDARYDR